jgi:hypothetical protein
MQAASPVSVLGAFDGSVVAQPGSRAAFRREGDRFLVRTEGRDGAEAEFAISETFGADPLQQYLMLFPDGRRQPLAWAWTAARGMRAGNAGST